METKISVDNSIYDQLGDRWYTAFDDPVALLRQESKIKLVWVHKKISELLGPSTNLRILDVGCGGGFLANAMAKSGHQVTGIDLSEESLIVAKKYDETGKVQYQKEDAYQMTFSNESFDVVTAMDFLEHVEKPELVVKEISRVLRPGGLFFYHTFNRNWISQLLVIWAVRLLVKNTPPRMHVIELFIKPEELKYFCEKYGMEVVGLTGIKPNFSTITLKGLLTRTVPKEFSFSLTASTLLSYIGVARKR